MNSQPRLQSKILTENSITDIETSRGNSNIYTFNNTNKQISCASRGSDFAFTQSGGFSLSAKDDTTKDSSIGAGIGDNSSAGVAELGGINSGVLLSREVMYRTCEFMANLRSIDGLTPDIAKELFKTSLEAVLTISADYEGSSETEQGTESISSSAPSEN